MSLTNCEINPILTWFENCVISSATAVKKFAITNTKLYVPVVTSSTQNKKLLRQLTSGFTSLSQVFREQINFLFYRLITFEKLQQVK